MPWQRSRQTSHSVCKMKLTVAVARMKLMLNTHMQASLAERQTSQLTENQRPKVGFKCCRCSELMQ